MDRGYQRDMLPAIDARLARAMLRQPDLKLEWIVDINATCPTLEIGHGSSASVALWVSAGRVCARVQTEVLAVYEDV